MHGLILLNYSKEFIYLIIYRNNKYRQLITLISLLLPVTRYWHVFWDDAECFVHRTKLCNSGTCRWWGCPKTRAHRLSRGKESRNDYFFEKCIWIIRMILWTGHLVNSVGFFSSLLPFLFPLALPLRCFTKRRS